MPDNISLRRSAFASVEHAVAEELLAKAFRMSPVAIAIVRLADMVVIDVNAAGLALVGCTRDELVGHTTEALAVDPTQRDRLRAALAKTPSVRDLPVKVRRSDGEVRETLMSVELVELGGEACMLTVITDVTDTRATERMLEEAQAIGRVGSWVADLRTGARVWSRECCRIFGLAHPPRDHAGYLALIDDEDRAAYVAVRDEAVRSGGELVREFRIVRPGGERRWVSARGLIERDAAGVPVRLTGTIRDITEDRARSEELRRSQELFHKAFHASPAAMVIASLPDVRILDVNDATLAIAGRTREETIGVTAHDLGIRIRRSRVEGGMRRPDGELRDVVFNSVVVDIDGKPRLLSVLTDVTERRRAERLLAEAESQLRHAQKMEAIGQLAGGIAHDFNNILSVVLSSATLIEDATAPNDPINEDARAIREVAERAAMLTRQLLAFSRRQVLAPRVVHLEQVLAGMDTMLRRLLGERVRLTLLAGDTANVLLDPSQFEQLVLNLAVNARDAMPDGGELTIDTEDIEVGAELAAGTGAHAGSYVRVRFTDTGSGMDATTRARMFEPFFTTKPTGKGTGLGLSTVFGIVRQSGGFIRVDSAPGQGTRVAIYLPRTERAEHATVPAQAPALERARGETILLVEDEEPVRRFVQRLLRRDGYEILAAANAGEALLLAEQRPAIDLLLTDVVMPLMNGRQLAERLRERDPGLAIIYMSGYHEDELLTEMVGAADAAYLQKPVSRELLLGRIREVLDRRRCGNLPRGDGAA